MALSIPQEIWLQIFDFIEMTSLISFASTSTNNLFWVVKYLKLDKDTQTTFKREHLSYIFNPGSFSFSLFKKKKHVDKYNKSHIIYTLISNFSSQVHTLFEHRVKGYIEKTVGSAYEHPYEDNQGDSEKWITIYEDWFSQRKTTIRDRIVLETQEIVYATHCDNRQDWPIGCTRKKPCETCESIYSSISKGLAHKCIPEQCRYCDFYFDCDCDRNEKDTAVLTNINRKTLVNGSYLGDQIIDGCRFTIVNRQLIWAKFPNGKSFRVNKSTMSKFNREMKRANPFFNSRFHFVKNFFSTTIKGEFIC
jgi:hypothetical protein